jgi:pyruvate kinase
MIRLLREAEQAAGCTQPTRILMDLGGPKVRTIRPKNKAGKTRFKVGDRLLLARHIADTQTDDVPIVGCTLPAVFDQLCEGAQVWIDDGQIGARVVSLKADGALLQISQAPPKGKKIRPEKGMNFPDTDLQVTPLTAKDRKDLDFVAANADMVGYSFVQSAEDVALLQEELLRRVPSSRTPPALVMKIETHRAVQNLPEIIVQAGSQLPTAVMIARGDLAVELGYERMAEIQEEMLWRCEAAYVPVIWATQVLESLAKEGVPSRAEVSDAAMADRAEGVMLNKGPFIVSAVELLDDVLLRMQGHQQKKTPQLRALRSWVSLFEPVP